jgi:uncharacterized membrane protein HdeD (DUF308 family)
LVSASRCSYGTAFMDTSRGDPAIRERLTDSFDAIGLEIFDDRELTILDGRQNRLKGLVTPHPASDRPTLIFFDERGNEVMCLDSETLRCHTRPRLSGETLTGRFARHERSCVVDATRIFAVVTILLGVAAIVLPYFFGKLAVMALGGVVLAGGIVSLLFVNDVRKQGLPVSVFGPWAQVIAGVVLLIWPELALWLVAVLLGGGLILSGITGLTALRDAGVINPPLVRKIGFWASIVLGVLLIAMGAFGSAILLGLVLGIALINAGLQQWRQADLVV